MLRILWIWKTTENTHKNLRTAHTLYGRSLRYEIPTEVSYNPLKGKVQNYFNEKIQTDENKNIIYEKLVINLREGIRQTNSLNRSILNPVSKILNVPKNDSLRNLTYIDIVKCFTLLIRHNKEFVYSKLYKNSMNVLVQAGSDRNLTIKEILFLMHLLTFGKKLSHSKIENLLTILPDIKKFSILEQCILAEFTYRNSVRLQPNVVSYFQEVIENQATYLVGNSTLLVPLCKVLRFNGHIENFQPNNLSQAIIKSSTKFNIRDATHILLLYAEMSFSETRVQERLISNVMEHYMKIHETLQVEKMIIMLSENNGVKYFDSLLYCTSKLRYKFKQSQYEAVVNILDKCFPHFSKYPTKLVNSLLSLWMMDHKLEQLVQRFFDEQIYKLIYINENRWKPVARLTTLINCVKIEAPHIKIPNQVQEIRVKNQQSKNTELVRVIFNGLRTKLNLEDVKVDFPILGINLAGISFNHPNKGLVHVDLLDETTCLKNTMNNTPNGLLDLKLRLLKKLGYTSVTINVSRIINSSNGSLIIEDIVNDIIRKK